MFSVQQINPLWGVEPGRMARLCEGLRPEDRGRRTVTLA